MQARKMPPVTSVLRNLTNSANEIIESCVQSKVAHQSSCPQSHKNNHVINNVEEFEIIYDPFLDPSIDLVKQVADDIRASVRQYTRRHKLKLVGITASRTFTPDATDVDYGADTYSEWIGKTCQEDDITYEIWRVAGGTNNTANQVQNLIDRANLLPDVTGILVYYPIYNKPYILGVNKDRYYHGQQWSIEQQKIQIENGCEDVLKRAKALWPSLTYKTRDDYFRDSVSASRDVEGLCRSYHSRKTFRDRMLYTDTYDGLNTEATKNVFDVTKDRTATNTIFPCTALAVVRILKRCYEGFDPSKPLGRRFEGVTITIINRSQIMGRPLASILANDGATVYSIDADSIVLVKPGDRFNRCKKVHKQTQACIQESSIIVTGVPSSTYKIPAEWILPNSTVINVASEPNVDEDELRDVPGVQYIPQIGKVTVALLEQNLVQLHQNFCSNDGLSTD